MPVTDTPLRYPGGKSQITPFVVELLEENALFDCTYVEPFAGGAGIAWTLLLSGYVSEVWINDIDRSIHSFWYSVLNETDALCERIAQTSISMEEWHKQKAVQQLNDVSMLDLGFSTLFLNRTNRAGILKGGVIGGKNQTGAYDIGCRFNKADIIAKIRRIALYRDQVTLTQQDAKGFLQRCKKKLPAHSLLNIDPPYYRQGPELYCSFYGHDDHVALSEVIGSLEQPWMLTYDDTPEIRAMYAGFPSRDKSLNYSAQVKRTAVEFLALSPSLAWPTSPERRIRRKAGPRPMDLASAITA